MNKATTLREHLKSCNINNVCEILYKRHVKDKSDSPYKFDECTAAYTNVINTLLRKRKTRSTMPIEVSVVVEENETYNNVSLLNPRYVEPPKNAKPWGGKNPPKGYYNCNASKYNKRFAFGNTSWAKLASSKVINSANLSTDDLISEILWEITFHGYTEKKIKAFFKHLDNLVKEITKKVKKEKQLVK